MSRKQAIFNHFVRQLIPGICLLLLAAPSIAAEARYKNPKVNGYALDYCLTWGTNCGKPAADAFCRNKGYKKALRFHVRKNTPPTRVIKSGQICSHAGCDRIDWLACAAEISFAQPRFRGYALDLCKHWGRDCGKPAADAYCRKYGYQAAVDFAVHHDTPPTRVIGDGKICKQSFCDRIVAITCKNKQNTGGSSSDCGKCDSGGETMQVPPDASEFVDFDF